ncbi:hypothetical protein D3C80_1572040 [compost metagenome]
MNKTTNACAVCLFQQTFRAVDVDRFQFGPVAAALVVVTKISGGVEQYVAPLQMRGKGGHIGHVAGDQLNAFDGTELPAAFIQRAYQRFDVATFCNQLSDQIIAEQPGGTGDKSRFHVHHH